MLCICGTTRILQRSTILESTNPSKVMVPISFWQVFPMLGKSKIQGSMIILISHFGIKNILAPTKVRNANLSLSKIIKGFLQCSLAIFIQWSIMNCKIHSKTKPSLIYNNNFQLLNNSYWIHHKLWIKNASVFYFFCFKEKINFVFSLYGFIQLFVNIENLCGSYFWWYMHVFKWIVWIFIFLLHFKVLHKQLMNPHNIPVR